MTLPRTFSTVVEQRIYAGKLAHKLRTMQGLLRKLERDFISSLRSYEFGGVAPTVDVLDHYAAKKLKLKCRCDALRDILEVVNDAIEDEERRRKRLPGPKNKGKTKRERARGVEAIWPPILARKEGEDDEQ